MSFKFICQRQMSGYFWQSSLISAIVELVIGHSSQVTSSGWEHTTMFFSSCSESERCQEIASMCQFLTQYKRHSTKVKILNKSEKSSAINFWQPEWTLSSILHIKSQPPNHTWSKLEELVKSERWHRTWWMCETTWYLPQVSSNQIFIVEQPD